MALFLVLEDFSDGSATISAGEVIDDAAIDLPRLQASGLAALAYVPGTMEASRLAFVAARGSRVVEPDTSGDLMALLIAAGAVPTGVASVSAAAPLLASAGPNVTVSIAPGTASGDVVKWDGVQWTVGTPDVGITELTGDVLAGPGNGAQAATVARLQGYSVAAIAPSLDGQVLTWNGSDWVPGLPPAGGSGGGGQTYFFNNGLAGDAPLPAVGTKELGLSAEAPLTTVTSGILPNTGVYALVAGFVTDLNKPGLTAIPVGLWDFNVWANASGPSNTANIVRFRLKVYVWNGVTATLLATSGVVPLYDPSQVIQYSCSALVPQTVILATDRIYVEIEATATANNHTITLSFGDAAPTHVHTTLPSIAGTGLVHVINGVVQSPASAVNLAGGAAEITGTLPIGNGGTGLATTPTNGQLLIGNGAGYTQATLTAGSGISITNGAGSISIAASGAVPVLEQDRMFVYEGEYFDDTNDEWREPKGNQAILARSGGSATTVANWANGRPAVLCSGGRMQVSGAAVSTPGNVLTIAVAGTYTALNGVGCYSIGNAHKVFGVNNDLVGGVPKLRLWPNASAPITAMDITSTGFSGNKFVYVARYLQRAFRHTIYVQGVGTFSSSSTQNTAQPFSYIDISIGGWYASGGVYEQPIACLHAYRYKSDAEMDAIRDALQAAYAL